MPFRIALKPDTRAKVEKALVARLQRAGDKAGAMLVEQAKRRFFDSGDEEVRWPDLWANNDTAVASVAAKQSLGREADAYRRAEIRRLEKTLARAELKGVAAKIRLARNKLNIAREEHAAGNPSYRRGGKALQDTGVLRSSITFRTKKTEKGVRVEWGPSVFYGRFQQTGFVTNKGVNYIPLTMRAKRKPYGADPRSLDLIPGHDYVLLRRVRVPARPFVRLTQANRAEVLRAMSRK